MAQKIKRTIPLVILLLLTSLLLTPLCSFSQNQELSKAEKKTFKTGQKFSKKGDYVAALEYFLHVHETNWNNIDNLYFITITYNDGLSDYGNAVKYGNLLLDLLHKENKTVEKYGNEYENNNELIEEIELLIVFADRDNVKIVNKDVSSDSEVLDSVDIAEHTVVVHEANVVETDNEEESSVVAKEMEQAEVTNETKYTGVADETENTTVENDLEHTDIETENEEVIAFEDMDSPNDEIQTSELNRYGEPENIELIVPFIGTEIFNTSQEHIELIVSESVNNKYIQRKSDPIVSYSQFLDNNTNVKHAIKNFRNEYLDSLYYYQSTLLEAINKYNNSLYKKDSINQILLNYTKLNSLMQEELMSIQNRKSQLEIMHADITKENYSSANSEDIFIGQHTIKKSLDDNIINELLNEIKLSVRDFENNNNSIIRSFVSFISTSNDIKNLYIIAKVGELGYELASHSRSGISENLNVYIYRSGKFLNIRNGLNVSSNDLGLSDEEVRLINGMKYSLMDNAQGQKENNVNLITIDELIYSISLQENNINTEIENNRIIFDSLNQYISNSIHLAKESYYEHKKNYDNWFTNHRMYLDYLAMNMEYASKTAVEQYIELADNILSQIHENWDDYYLTINKFSSCIDTSSGNARVRFTQEQVALQPVLNSYEILSMSKIKINDTGKLFFGIDIGFVIKYSIPESTSIEESVFQEPDVKEIILKTPDENISSKEIAFTINKVDNVLFLNDQNNKKWKALEENPSSYSSYKFFQEEEGWRLPDYEELKSILTYLASHKDVLGQLDWGNEDYIYLSGDTFLDNRSNEINKGIRLVGTGIEDQNVASGDEVFLIVIMK